MICDFCGIPNPAWVYPAEDFEMFPGHSSRGGWSACDRCHAAIETGGREALHVVAMERCRERRGRKAAESLDAAVWRQHEDFFRHRTGPCHPMTAAEIEEAHSDPEFMPGIQASAEVSLLASFDNIEMRLSGPIPRPTQYLSFVAGKFPEVWKKIEFMRAAAPAEGASWPPHCFFPRALTTGIAMNSAGRSQTTQFDEVAGLWIAALSAWRMTQGIYRFDQVVMEELVKTPLNRELPSELFRHLPEWCVYIETPGWKYGGQEQYGFFAWVDAMINPGTYEELVILLDLAGEDGLSELSPFPPILLDSGSLDESLSKTRGMVIESRAKQMAAYQNRPDLLPAFREQATKLVDEALGDMDVTRARAMVSLLIYLCSENSEVLDRVGKRKAPAKPQMVKTKHGMKLFPMEGPAHWDVAFRLGAALRRAMEQARSVPQGGTHASPRPHVRNAHWHSFWTGPKARPDKPQKTGRLLVVKWLPPIPVNLDSPDDLVPAIKGV